MNDLIISAFVLLLADSALSGSYKVADEDTSVELECGKRPVNPGDRVKWAFRGMDVLTKNLHKRFSVDTRGYLHIYPTKRNDTGLYLCESRRTTPDGDLTFSVNMYLNVRCEFSILFLFKLTTTRC